MTPGRFNGPPFVLHNMSVPSTSQVKVAFAVLPGLRYRVCLHEQVGRSSKLAHEWLAKRGWRAAWDLLEAEGDAPRKPKEARRQREVLERHLEQALEAAGVPDTLGLFVCQQGEPDLGTLLPPAAALAVLSRRSGPLYIPTRRLDPSLAHPAAMTLFFPEEPR